MYDETGTIFEFFYDQLRKEGSSISDFFNSDDYEVEVEYESSVDLSRDSNYTTVEMPRL